MVLGSSSSAQALAWSGPGTGAGTMVADAPRPSLLLLHLRLTRISPTLLRVLADDAHVDSLAPLSGSSPGAQAFGAAFGSAGAGLAMVATSASQHALAVRGVSGPLLAAGGGEADTPSAVDSNAAPALVSPCAERGT